MPVSREDILGWELAVGPPALIVHLHVQQREHAPVGDADDTPHPGAGPVPAIHLDILD